MRHSAVPVLAFLALASGCVPPRSLSPTIDAQRSAISAIRVSYDADLALLAAQLDAALAMRRTLLLGRIDRELVELGYLDADTGPQRLRDDLANASASNSVVDDLRAGRLTLHDADRLLADYRAAEALTDPLATSIRTQLLERLHAVRAFDQTATALRVAMTDHAADIAWLFDESERSSEALHTYAQQQPRLPQAITANAPELWSRLVLTRIADPAKRAAAEQLLADLLSLATAATPQD